MCLPTLITPPLSPPLLYKYLLLITTSSNNYNFTLQSLHYIHSSILTLLLSITLNKNNSNNNIINFNTIWIKQRLRSAISCEYQYRLPRLTATQSSNPSSSLDEFVQAIDSQSVCHRLFSIVYTYPGTLCSSVTSPSRQKAGHHDTTVHEKVAPAVVNEQVIKQRHEEAQTAIDREVHQDHFHTSVQPVKDREVLPEQHSHRMAGVEHREIQHGDSSAIKARLEEERAQFQNTRTEAGAKETHSVAPVIAGEHVHHHVHEVGHLPVQSRIVPLTCTLDNPASHSKRDYSAVSRPHHCPHSRSSSERGQAPRRIRSTRRQHGRLQEARWKLDWP